MDGKYHVSSIDLDHHYMNRRGEFDTGRDFSHTAQDIVLTTSLESVRLTAKLGGPGGWPTAWTELSLNILVRDGSLVFEKQWVVSVVVVVAGAR
jgi:hypothetical protein